RLRGLNPAAPENLKAAAIKAAAVNEEEGADQRSAFLPAMGAAVVVLVLVVLVLSATAAPAHNLFSNISAGLGT
ncbi:MAG: hypothetical protein ACR2MY_09635, partial [Candidatus Dormibacteria bacterium]